MTEMKLAQQTNSILKNKITSLYTGLSLNLTNL